MKTLLRTTALVLALTTGANAGQLLGGPIYAGNANFAYCWYTNLGAASVTPTAQVMYEWASATALTVGVNCANGTPIGQGKSCYIYPSVDSNGYSCKVVFSTGVANVRGSLELLDSGGNFISQVELR